MALQYSKGSLLGGDWDLANEYDPLWPNDYEALKRDAEPTDRPEPQQDSRDKEADARRGATIAPPPSLLETPANVSSVPSVSAVSSMSSVSSVSSVAHNIMRRMGYREGQGLGREEQGIAAPLVVEKTSKRGGKIVANSQPEVDEEEAADEQSVTELLRRPSKVVLLRNMVGRGQVDEELEGEVSEECSKYGQVASVRVTEDQLKADEEAVRIFIEFTRVEAAVKAVVDLNGRFFGGRSVKASFFDWNKFKRQELT